MLSDRQTDCRLRVQSRPCRDDRFWRRADLRNVGYQQASVLVDGRTPILAIGQCRNSERDDPAGLVVRGRSRSADPAAVRR
jgi:hypothetical protein